jgi:pimeloyl-ACP methyl ester carboxylesterase
MITARKQMKKHRMNPANPTYQILKNKTLQEIKEGKLKAPTLVIWGHNDPSTTYEVGMNLFKYVSSSTLDSQLHIFNNCGHSPYIEYPEEFNRLIESFCGTYVIQK